MLYYSPFVPQRSWAVRCDGSSGDGQATIVEYEKKKKDEGLKGSAPRGGTQDEMTVPAITAQATGIRCRWEDVGGGSFEVQARLEL